MKDLHYFSGLTLLIFISGHLFNHFCSIFSISLHIEIMDILRNIYRNPVIEVLLLTAVIFQIISGIRLILKKNKAGSFYEKIHVWSGIYMALFLIIHVSAVLTGRFILHLDTNFYFGVAGINNLPFSLFFVPYYGLAILSLFAHLAAVHLKKMKYDILGIQPLVQANTILLTGVVITIFIFYGLTNHFHGVNIPKTYYILIGK
ncbi:hypothetical protein ATE49_19165 [Elizabethkingia miricola]|uniref:DUF4405 domain-containing protein n=2 Tax=Elizabethkingia miricola TaxID=172045 RepID=A0ABY3NGJ6_ELIMR|nr:MULTISPECIES: hypothetical protein [Elizabethkingia]OBS14759.1 hypothetical protein ATE49_19165 [Elizabethkingia miricola]TYO92072.1 hypothetical protein LX74_01730 [Elizabethkingia miricola]